MVGKMYKKLYIYLLIFSSGFMVYFFINETTENILIYMVLYIFFNINLYIVLFKLESILIKINFLFLYFGYFISMPLIFMHKEKYTRSGWSGIGDYAFEIHKTIEAFSVIIFYIVFFVFFSYFLDKLFLKKYNFKNIGYSNFNIIENKVGNLKYLFLLIILAQIFISYVMAQYRIGIVGLFPEDGLPFRIAGISYYFRYIMIPLMSLLVLFSFKGRALYIVIPVVLLEVLSAAIFSGSRALIIMHILPILVYSIVYKKNYLMILFLLYTLILFSVATLLRDLFYSSDNFDFFIIIDFLKNFLDIEIEILFQMFTDMIIRMLGYKEFFATYFNDLKYVDFNLFLSNVLGFKFLYNGEFNATTDVFALAIPEGKSFALAIDPLSLIYLSSNSVVHSLLLLLIWAAFLLITEKIFILIFHKYKNSYLFLLLLMVYALLGLIQPTIRDNFIFLPLIILIIYILIVNIIFQRIKEKHEKFYTNSY